MGSAETPAVRPAADGRRLSRSDFLAELEAYVKDYLLSDLGGDGVLDILIDLTLEAERSQRPLYADPIREPYFYSRYVRRWILEGVQECAAIQGGNQKLWASLSNRSG